MRSDVAFKLLISYTSVLSRWVQIVIRLPQLLKDNMRFPKNRRLQTESRINRKVLANSFVNLWPRALSTASL